MATNYQRGRAFEYRARNALLKRGAVYVMRAAQSKGKVDLLALFPAVEGNPDLRWEDAPRYPDAWLVQCKTGSARMSPADRDELIRLAVETGSIPILAQPGKNGRGVEFVNLLNEGASTV